MQNMAVNKNPKRKKKDSGLFEEKVKLSYDSPFAYREAYNTLRANLIFSLAASSNGKKCIVVSSPMPNDGKSSTSANLAISLAQFGAKVLLVDADLRKPTQHKIFKLSNKIGITNLIAKQDTFENIVHKDVEPNLDIITSGIIPPNPSEMLGSKAMVDLVAEFDTMYDYVIIDTPPLLIVTDAIVLADITAGIVLTLKANSSTINDVSSIVSDLEMAKFNILGVVLVAVTNRFDLYKSYTTKYKYKYKYNYTYGKEK